MWCLRLGLPWYILPDCNSNLVLSKEGYLLEGLRSCVEAGIAIPAEVASTQEIPTDRTLSF